MKRTEMALDTLVCIEPHDAAASPRTFYQIHTNSGKHNVTSVVFVNVVDKNGFKETKSQRRIKQNQQKTKIFHFFSEMARSPLKSQLHHNENTTITFLVFLYDFFQTSIKQRNKLKCSNDKDYLQRCCSFIIKHEFKNIGVDRWHAAAVFGNSLHFYRNRFYRRYDNLLSHMLHCFTNYDMLRSLMLVIFRAFAYKSIYSNLIWKQLNIKLHISNLMYSLSNWDLVSFTLLVS
jgi:hypothetical protein